jgi:hypothetical protein
MTKRGVDKGLHPGGLVACRLVSWPPVNGSHQTHGMSPGIREGGPHTISNLRSSASSLTLPEGRKNGGISALAAPNAPVGGPITIDGKGRIHQSAPPKTNGGFKTPTLTDPSVGAPLVPTGGGASFSDGLESQLRDAIRRINK